MADCWLGVDLGTTSMKAIVFDDLGSQVGSTTSVATRWYRDEFGGTVLDLEALVSGVFQLVQSACADPAVQALGEITGIGLAGMAETGALLDADALPVWPAIAWHDSRGADEAADLARSEPEFARDFSWRTGLPLDAQASFSKALWLQGHRGGGQPGRCWLSIPEYAAYALTGAMYAEPSLLSRTGLYDHPSDDVWHRALELAGLDPAVIPEIRNAGTSWGSARGFDGVQVTVAGHDHLVAAIGAGVTEPGQMFNSCGTADVLLRVVDRWPDRDSFARLAPLNISMGHHPLRRQYVFNVGTKAGLVLGRLHDLLGAIPEDAAPTDSAGAVTVTLPEPGFDHLEFSLHAPTSALVLWNQAMEELVEQSHKNVGVIEDIFGPYSAVVCGGGWTRAEAVRRMKQAMYRNVSFCEASEPGCLGAALAAKAAGQRPRSAVDRQQ